MFNNLPNSALGTSYVQWAGLVLVLFLTLFVVSFVAGSLPRA